MANQGEHIVALTDRKALREEDSVGPPEEDEESDIGAARKSHDKRVIAIFVVSFGVLALLSTFSAFKLLDWIYFFYALVFSTIFVSLGVGISAWVAGVPNGGLQTAPMPF